MLLLVVSFMLRKEKNVLNELYATEIFVILPSFKACYFKMLLFKTLIPKFFFLI